MKEGDVHKKCYGAMTSEVAAEGRMVGSGKVFSFEITHPGGIGPPVRKIEVGPHEWDDCCKCPEFDHCYKFSMMQIVFRIMVYQM